METPNKLRRGPELTAAQKLAIGRAIRAAREAKQISAAALAEAAGLTKAAIYRYEDGSTAPTLGTLFPLAAAIRMTPSALLKAAEKILSESGPENG